MSSNPKTLQAYADGTLVHTMNLATDDAKPYRFASITKCSGTYLSVNYGQQPFVYTPPGGYESLQTWEEYARSSLSYALIASPNWKLCV